MFWVGWLHFTAAATIELPAVISSGMVLQQQSRVPLWGKAKARYNIRVTPSWNQKTYTVTSDSQGNWRVWIETPAAGGPYWIRVADDRPVELKDVLVGEVWVCSGQSNMEMPMRGYFNQPILNANDLLADAGNDAIRLFHVERAVSVTPSADCKGSWQRSTSESAAGFSAVGFQFAKRLQQVLKVPVGMIQAAWGGTPIEAWTDRQSLLQLADRTISLPVAGQKADRLKPTCLYNGMISPIEGYGIKGFLWYQGEGNVPRPAAYAALMKQMVSGWRKAWQNEALYFYYVQIAPWNYGPRKLLAPYLREAQQKAQAAIPRSGMVVSIDKGSATTIHPPDKTAISNRLLYHALGEAYQMKGIAYQSPVFEQMTIKKDTVLVRFTHANNGFFSTTKEIQGFEVAGSDQKFFSASAKLVRTGIEVTSPQVPDPVAVRYAFKDWVNGSLYNVEGLPVAPFRTDDWQWNN